MEIPEISIPEIHIPNVPEPYNPHYINVAKPPDIDEDFNPTLAEEYSMVTNLSCPKCNSYVEVYLAKQ